MTVSISITGVVAVACLLLVFCSLAYYFLCLLAASRFHGEPGKPASLSGVSLLKPLKGCDPDMHESLRSHCLQDYPTFEIIFGVNDAADEAIPYIERLKDEFPNVPMRTVVSKEVLGANRKISNLVQMLRLAEHDHVLINDGDIRVPENYLRDVMSEFASPGPKKVGMVTCLYRGVPGKTLWSTLESIGINVDFMAGILTAKLLEGHVRFALGSTMATTKEAIAAIGGLETLVDYLADDYELGKRISEKGYRVVLSQVVVETFLPDYNFKDFSDHQLRWGRTVRSSRPGGYFGMVTTFGPFWALCALLLRPSPATLMLLAASVAGKGLVSHAVGRKVTGDRRLVKNLWLLPLRELLTPAFWLLSLLGNKIVWRGEVFTLRDGKLLQQ